MYVYIYIYWPPSALLNVLFNLVLYLASRSKYSFMGCIVVGLQTIFHLFAAG